MQPKIQMLENRPHLVAPVVLGVAGVWNGSQGPVYYPPGELAKSVPLWNGKPVVIFHPTMETSGFAGHPKVFNRQRVGTLFNARFDPVSRKLTAEAWLDPERLQSVDPRVMAAVKSGKIMEVSTGLHVASDGKPGSFNGRTYIGTGRNYVPDHLAILPEGEGACSVKMGAGLCRNANAAHAGFRQLQRPLVMPRFVA